METGINYEKHAGEYKGRIEQYLKESSLVHIDPTVKDTLIDSLASICSLAYFDGVIDSIKETMK